MFAVARKPLGFGLLFVALFALFALLVVQERSISLYELRYLDAKGVGFWLVQGGIALFGQNNLGYLLPFVTLFACNTILLCACIAPARQLCRFFACNQRICDVARKCFIGLFYR